MEFPLSHSPSIMYVFTVYKFVTYISITIYLLWIVLTCPYICVPIMYQSTYVSTECIELITATSEATNVITTITTAITHTTTNTTTATTSSSVSVVTPTTVQITSSQNTTGTYVCS